jgi:hypothetical protein
MPRQFGNDGKTVDRLLRRVMKGVDLDKAQEKVGQHLSSFVIELQQ